jgi:hypothetical protein
MPQQEVPGRTGFPCFMPSGRRTKVYIAPEAELVLDESDRHSQAAFFYVRITDPRFCFDKKLPHQPAGRAILKYFKTYLIQIWVHTWRRFSSAAFSIIKAKFYQTVCAPT